MTLLLAQTLLAQGTCPDDTPACTWLLDQGAPEWIATVLGGLAAQLLGAVTIVVITSIVVLIVRRVVTRIGQRFLDRPAPGPNVARGALTLMATPDPRRRQRIESVTAVARSIMTALVWTIGIFMALGAFNLNLGPLIASAGIVGVALGFGAQSLVQDFLSGLFMLAEDQFGIGDVIDVGEAEGVVESISLRTTALRSVDGTLWFVPNGEIRRVGNMSQDWARALLDVSVGYDADIDQAIEVIRATAEAFVDDPAQADLVLEPPEILGVQDLGADAVVIRVWIKTLPGKQWGLSRELRRRLKVALDDADIDIPYPQRTVWVRHHGTPDDDRQVPVATGPSPTGGPDEDRSVDGEVMVDEATTRDRDT